jgi:hypothetical protein
MLLLATIFSLHLLHSKPAAETPAPVCNTSIVSHKFVGDPGTAFVYDGDRFVIPASGWIELIAIKGADNYQMNDRRLPLNVWPRDEFGTEIVRMPSRSSR